MSVKFFCKLSFVLTLSLGFIARADFVVEDPNNELGKLHWFSHKTLSSDFVCGQRQSYSSKQAECFYKCTTLGCNSECNSPPTSSFDLFIEDCNENSVAIYGTNGFSTLLTQEDYKLGGNTPIIALIKSLGHYIHPEAKATVSYVFWNTFQELKEGAKVNIGGYTIQVDLEFLPNTQSIPIEINLAPQYQGLDQIISIRDDKDVFLKRKGIILQ